MFYRLTILSGEMNFAGKTNHFTLRAWLTFEARDNFSLHRIYGSTMSSDKRWYRLTSQLVDSKVSQFVKGKYFHLSFFEVRSVAFRSAICDKRARSETLVSRKN